MSTQELIREKRDVILRLASQYGASNIRLFGSVAKGTDTPESDIDFLVDMEPDRSLLDRIGLMQALQDEFGRNVDVLTEHTLHQSIRETILNEAVFV